MCNLYSLIEGQVTVCQVARVVVDHTRDLPLQLDITPDSTAPIVRHGLDGRELAMARWGLPSPDFALRGRNTDPGITNIRNTRTAHWQRWLDPEHRCLVPFTSFSENRVLSDGSHLPMWFALSEDRPLAFFAGIQVRRWAGRRRMREGEVVAGLFGFLTTKPNAKVRAMHPKALQVILTRADELEAWMTGPASEVAAMQQPLADGALMVVARGEKHDDSPALA